MYKMRFTYNGKTEVGKYRWENLETAEFEAGVDVGYLHSSDPNVKAEILDADTDEVLVTITEE